MREEAIHARDEATYHTHDRGEDSPRLRSLTRPSLTISSSTSIVFYSDLVWRRESGDYRESGGLSRGWRCLGGLAYLLPTAVGKVDGRPGLPAKKAGVVSAWELVS